jgi:hypothetical protein
MTKKLLTYEIVKETCDNLINAGIPPSSVKVHDRLNIGSKTTLLQFYRQYLNEKNLNNKPKRELPPLFATNIPDATIWGLMEPFLQNVTKEIEKKYRVHITLLEEQIKNFELENCDVLQLLDVADLERDEAIEKRDNIILERDKAIDDKNSAIVQQKILSETLQKTLDRERYLNTLNNEKSNIISEIAGIVKTLSIKVNCNNFTDETNISEIKEILNHFYSILNNTNIMGCSSENIDEADSVVSNNSTNKIIKNKKIKKSD